ncbi:MAG: HNH endonuclease [Defluviitaleaceae bacterium]|nr:HNH endonuclease [Defluviitaleaceae bacterium]
MELWLLITNMDWWLIIILVLFGLLIIVASCVAYDTSKTMKNSTLCKNIVSLNAKYSNIFDNDIKKRYKFTWEVNSLQKYEKCSKKSEILAYFCSPGFEDIYHSAMKNSEILKKYTQEYHKLIEETASKDEVFRKKEVELCQSLLLEPILNPEMVCVVTYTSPKDKSNLRTKHSILFEDFLPTYNIKNNSALYKSLMLLNMEYRNVFDNDVKESYEIVWEVNSLQKYEKYNKKSEIFAYLCNSDFEYIYRPAIKNNEIFQAYTQEYHKLIEETASKDEIFRKKEIELCQSFLLEPVLNPETVCVVTYASPKDKNNFQTKHSILFEDFLPTYKVKNNSALYKNLMSLNTEYRDILDNDVKESYEITWEVNSLQKYKKCSNKSEILAYFCNPDFEYIHRPATKNNETFQAYTQKYHKLIEETASKDEIFRRKEIELCQFFLLEPPILNPKIVCEVTYTSPKGKNSYRQEQSILFEDFLKISSKRKDFESSKKYQRTLMTNSLRYDILERDGYKCKICGSTAKDGAKLEVDHIIPIAKGGKTIKENLQTLCEICNSGKRDKIPKVIH